MYKQLERYKNFTFLEKPAPFNMLFHDQDFPLVQLHDVHNCGSNEEPYVVGFVGVFSWKDNTLTSLDGDTYYDDMEVVGYNTFDYDGDIALDILAEEW